MNSDGVASSSAGQELRLKVKTLQPATYEITAAAQATVRQLKEKLVHLSNIPTERQRLIFRGAVLQDTQVIATAHIEDGHTLHLVERPEGVPPSNTAQERTQQHQQHQQGQRGDHRRAINIGVIDTNGVMSAAGGGFPNFLDGLMAANGNHQMQMVTHPPAGNQEGGSQVIQIMSVSGGTGQIAPPTHQLTALNRYLLQLETRLPQTSMPPFSIVSRLGRTSQDEAAFVEIGRAALNGAVLSDSVETFVDNLCAQRRAQATAEAAAPPQPDAQAAAGVSTSGQTEDNSQPGTSEQQGRRDPRRNGIDGAATQPGEVRPPRPVPMSPDMLRFASLVVAQTARQSLRHIQSRGLPALASAVNSLQNLAVEDRAQGSAVFEQARDISINTYSLGTLLLELSFAASNLAQAGNGNSGPLISAQTGFLSADGSHEHVTNRVPSLIPVIPGMQGRVRSVNAQPFGQRAPTPGGAPSAGGSGVPRPPSPTGQSQAGAQQAFASGNLTPNILPEADMLDQFGVIAQMVNGGNPEQQLPPFVDRNTPLGLAYLNAGPREQDRERPRHMRMPVRLPDGYSYRLDMSPVISAVEAMILSSPTPVIHRVLQNAVPVSMAGQETQTLRELMSARQTDEQRRQIYLALTQPILQSLEHHLQSYFQQLYRVAPEDTDQPSQPVVRPTRRTAVRSVPLLSHPQALPLTPAREGLRANGSAGAPAEPQRWVHGGHVQMQISLEAMNDTPAPVQQARAQQAQQPQQHQQPQQPQSQGSSAPRPPRQPPPPTPYPSSAPQPAFAITPQIPPLPSLSPISLQSGPAQNMPAGASFTAAAVQPMHADGRPYVPPLRLDPELPNLGGLHGTNPLIQQEIRRHMEIVRPMMGSISPRPPPASTNPNPGEASQNAAPRPTGTQGHAPIQSGPATSATPAPLPDSEPQPVSSASKQQGAVVASGSSSESSSQTSAMPAGRPNSAKGLGASLPSRNRVGPRAHRPAQGSERKEMQPRSALQSQPRGQAGVAGEDVSPSPDGPLEWKKRRVHEEQPAEGSEALASTSSSQSLELPRGPEQRENGIVKGQFRRTEGSTQSSPSDSQGPPQQTVTPAISAAPSRSLAHRNSRGSPGHDLPELAELSEEDAQRWKSQIMSDREKRSGQTLDGPLSSDYLIASGNSDRASLANAVEIAQLD